MPSIIVRIEWDMPDEPFWLNSDNVAVALHAYCKNTRFMVTSIQQAVGPDAAIAPQETENE